METGGAAFENCTTITTGCLTGTESDAAGGMRFPAGVAVDPPGRIIVTDLSERAGRSLRGRAGRDGRFRPGGVGVDTGGAAFENCTTATGCQAGTASGAAGGMNLPFGVAVDAQGRIVVSDRFSQRVDHFSPGPTVTVTKALSPAGDPGTFDLRVDAVVVRARATNGQSGSLQVADGVDVTISEQAANPQHPLSNYDVTIDCGSGPKRGTNSRSPTSPRT